MRSLKFVNAVFKNNGEADIHEIKLSKDGINIGSISLRDSDYIDRFHKNYLNIMHVVVNDPFKRMGYGKLLYQKALELSKELGYKGIWSCSSDRSELGDIVWKSFKKSYGKQYTENFVIDFSGEKVFVTFWKVI